MKRILLPLDGSDLAEHALPWAELLARAYGCEIELLQCYEPLASVYLLPEFAPPPAYYDQSAHFEQIDSYLETIVDRLPEGMGKKLRCEGSAASAILDRGGSGDIDMIVLASHGRGGLGRWLLGSVATKVLRGSETPVMVINAIAEVPAVPQIKRVMVCLDGSETSEAALPPAESLCRTFGAEMHLYRGVSYTPIGHPTLDKAVELEMAQAREYLEEIKSRYPGLHVTCKVKAAGSKLGIVEEAHGCDLVVMGSHGRGGFQHWLLGSVTENVMQKVDRPLLVVRSEHD